jgi:hypothetical protein
VFEGKFALGSVARVGLAKDSMAVTWDDLARLEGLPDISTDLVIGGIFANLSLHLGQPDENLLVGKTMKRTGKTIKGSSKGEERIGEGGADKLPGVSRDIATFVVRVDYDVQPQELNKRLVVAKAEKVGKIVRIILGRIDSREFAFAIDIAVDATGDVGKLGNAGIIVSLSGRLQGG